MGEIPFCHPHFFGEEIELIKNLSSTSHYHGNGEYTNLCEQELEKLTKAKKVLLTGSCTQALEMMAILLDIKKGDEIIMPSFNFVSAGNAFALRGAKIVFVDLDPITMNIDPYLAEKAITSNTKAILVMHYGGVSCDMKTLMEIGRKNKIKILEDAAHCIGAFDEEGHHLGSRGDLSCLSFHDTKNIHCGEGGALLINDESFIERSEIIREKGTNRKSFELGLVEKYSWVDLGSSFLVSELNAAFLFGQLKHLVEITNKRRSLYDKYYEAFIRILNEKDLPPKNKNHNGHIFYLKCKSKEQRSALIKALASKEISAYFHYSPLHTSPFGSKFSFIGDHDLTSKESSRILRLPLYYGMTMKQCNIVIEEVTTFFSRI